MIPTLEEIFWIYPNGNLGETLLKPETQTKSFTEVKANSFLRGPNPVCLLGVSSNREKF